MCFLPFSSLSRVTWTTFLLCVFLHMYANYRAMRALILHSLNRPRLLYVLSSWLNSFGASKRDPSDGVLVPPPAEANLNEPLLFGPAFKSGVVASSVLLVVIIIVRTEIVIIVIVVYDYQQQ